MKIITHLRKLIYPYEDVVREIPPYSNILDIGCGNSHILEDFTKLKIISYTGIDPKVKNKIEKENISISNKKIEEFIEEIDKFDCILMIDVMHHLQKEIQEILFRNIITSMKKNSIFIYKDISNRNKFFSFMNWAHDLLYNFQNINYFSSDKIKLILNNNRVVYKHYFKRVFWYDHEFFIIRNRK